MEVGHQMANSKIQRHPNFIDISGQQFNRLVVIRFHGMNSKGKAEWLCLCVCGSEKVIYGRSLRSGQVQSCGCLRRDGILKTTHGHFVRGKMTPEYQAYVSAKRRCGSPKSASYKHYGARGIEFRFASFEEFLAELGMKPTPKHSLDRKDNEGHYERGNVRWATQSEQNANRRPYKHFTHR